MNFSEIALKIIREKTALVISGGGTNGVGEVGSLKRLEELGLDLKKIKSVSGSSVGSIISTAIACGASVEYIKNKMNSIDFKLLEDHKCFLIEGLHLLNNFGLHSMKEVDKLVSSVLIELGYDKDITFQQLYDRTNVWLTITYLSMNYKRTIFADHIYEPNSIVREAILKSSAIPMFYEAFFEGSRANKQVAVDGGTTLNFPMIIPRLQKVNPIEILGLKFISTGDVNVRDEGQPGIPEEDEGAPKNIVSHLTMLFDILRRQALKVHVHENDWLLSVKINVGTLSSTNFDMTEAEKEWLFQQGIDGVNKYVSDLEKHLENGIFPYFS